MGEDCPQCDVEVTNIITFGGEEDHIEYRRCNRKPMEMGEQVKCGFYEWCETCKCRFACATRRL